MHASSHAAGVMPQPYGNQLGRPAVSLHPSAVFSVPSPQKPQQLSPKDTEWQTVPPAAPYVPPPAAAPFGGNQFGGGYQFP